jgi:hypothetical protein
MRCQNAVGLIIVGAPKGDGEVDAAVRVSEQIQQV